MGQLVPKNCFLQISQYRSLKSKKFKNLIHLFSNFDSGRTSQLVPNPFKWSPTHSTGPQQLFFYRNLSIGRSNQKNSKNLVHLFSNFDSGRPSQLVPNPFNWSPTHSTGPQKLFLQKSQYRSLKSKKIKKLSPFIF